MSACHIKPLVVLRRGRCGCAGIRCSPCSAGSPYYYYSSASPPKPAPRRAPRPPQPRPLLPVAQAGPRPGRHRLRQHHHQALSRRLPRRQYQPRARRCQCQPRPRRRHLRRLLRPRLRHPRRPLRSAAIRSAIRERAMSRVNSAGTPTTGRVVWRATVNPSFARTTTGGAGNQPDPRRKRGRFHDPEGSGALFDPDPS